MRRNGVLWFASQYKCDADFKPLRHGLLGDFWLHTLSSMLVLSTYLGYRVLRKKVASSTWLMTFCHSPHPLDPKLNPYPTEPSMHGCFFFTLRLVTPFHPFNFGSGGMGGVAECHQSMYWMLLLFAKHGPQDRCSKQTLSLVCAARKIT